MKFYQSIYIYGDLIFLRKNFLYIDFKKIITLITEIHPKLSKI